jgi:hypothetical protein
MTPDTCTETGIEKIVHGRPVEAFAISDGDSVVLGVVRTGRNGDHFKLSLALTREEARHFLEVARAAVDASERGEAA